MVILGIETSCDETAAAVVEDGVKILSNVVATSSKMHAKTGGIIPEQAARQQVKSIISVVQEALYEAFPQKSLTTSYQLLATKIDAIAVTVGPGLIGSLLVGVETAKTLAYVWNKPIVPVNHLVGHIYANWLTDKLEYRNTGILNFPALALVVSGGHTDLVLMKDHGNLTWIGGTRDDAAGEAFDKCARLLGLPYPGGPSISKEAEKFLKSKNLNHKSLNLFPRPLTNEENFDFSFSGLKTAVLREVRNTNPSTLALRRGELAAQIQEAIVDSLLEKSIKAIIIYKPESFLLAGGVTANKRLREKFLCRLKSEGLKAKLHVPQPSLCTDNAAFIASEAFFNHLPVAWKKISINPELDIADNQNS